MCKEEVLKNIRLPGPVEKMYLLYLVSGKMLYLRKLIIGSLSCLNCIPNPCSQEDPYMNLILSNP